MNLIATFLMLLPSAPALAQQEVQTVRRPDSLLAGSTKSPTDTPAGKTYKKHDHLQIIVRERASARAQADFDNDRRSRAEIELEAWPRLVTRSGGFPRATMFSSTPRPGSPTSATAGASGCTYWNTRGRGELTPLRGLFRKHEQADEADA